MSTNPHITQALARERTADLVREAASSRADAETSRANPAEPRPQGSHEKPFHLIPAGAQER
jgi:hypothetical protein